MIALIKRGDNVQSSSLTSCKTLEQQRFNATYGLKLSSLSDRLLPPVLAHCKNLNHPDKDVDEVQLEMHRLINRILSNDALLC
jgi:hypothetical protein